VDSFRKVTIVNMDSFRKVTIVNMDSYVDPIKFRADWVKHFQNSNVFCSFADIFVKIQQLRYESSTCYRRFERYR
jgi:hypothetical protein